MRFRLFSLRSLRAVSALALLILGVPFAADVQARPQNNPGQSFVPGHYAWNARAQHYVWVPSRWERNARGQRSAGIGWTFSNGRWQFTPGR